jgi:DNA-binding NarL/FixJ family response regulator
LAGLARETPDVVILDLSLNEEDGLGLIKTIRDDYPGITVLVLTMHDETFYAEQALRAGALGYLTKQEASANVLTAIRSLLGGEMYVSDVISPRLVKRLLGGPTMNNDPLMDRLSDRERQVFESIGLGLTMQDIAVELDLSSKTVETYRGHILEKLYLRNSRELTQYAVRWALKRKSPPSTLDS